MVALAFCKTYLPALVCSANAFAPLNFCAVPDPKGKTGTTGALGWMPWNTSWIQRKEPEGQKANGDQKAWVRGSPFERSGGHCSVGQSVYMKERPDHSNGIPSRGHGVGSSDPVCPASSGLTGGRGCLLCSPLLHSHPLTHTTPLRAATSAFQLHFFPGGKGSATPASSAPWTKHWPGCSGIYCKAKSQDTAPDVQARGWKTGLPVF